MTESSTSIDLVAESQSIAPLPAAAATAYAEVLQPLVQRVTRRLLDHPRRDELLGGNPVSLFVDNHRDHAMFMAEVFSTNAYDLLAVSLPWIYHAYHSHGVHYDYFKIELEAWRKEISDCLEPQSAAQILTVYDWMLDCHQRVVELADLRRDQHVQVSDTDQSDFQALMKKLLASDDVGLLVFCREQLAAGRRLPEFLHMLVYPAMKEIGLLWESAQISVEDEHQATAILNRVLSAVYLDQQVPAPYRGQVIVASTMNEYHELGAWIVSTCLELDGWDVVYLGANVPTNALIERVEKNPPDIVALSVSMPFNLRAAREAITMLRQRAPGTGIVVGGQVFQMLPTLGATMGADACLSSCLEAMTWARSWGRDDPDAQH